MVITFQASYTSHLLIFLSFMVVYYHNERRILLRSLPSSPRRPVTCDPQPLPFPVINISACLSVTRPSHTHFASAQECQLFFDGILDEEAWNTRKSRERAV